MNAKKFLGIEFDTELTYEWYDGPLLWFTKNITDSLGRKVRALVQIIPTESQKATSYLYSIFDYETEIYLQEGKLAVRDAILKETTFNFIINEPHNKEKEPYVSYVYLSHEPVEDKFLPAENYFLSTPN